MLRPGNQKYFQSSQYQLLFLFLNVEEPVFAFIEMLVIYSIVFTSHFYNMSMLNLH